MEKIIPFSKPDIGEEEIEAVNRVLRSGWLCAAKETKAFEQEFSTYISPPGEKYYCIFTNSCTSALKMAYKWAKEQGYTDVAYPANTFCATYSAAEEMGLKTHPIDEGELIKIDNIEKAKIAVVLVDYGGIKMILDSCLIEDSAHRIEPNDHLVGKIRCYSFYVTKNMTTGSGGMFVTNDRKIYEQARLWWRDGLSTSTQDRLKGNPFYEVKASAGGYDGNDIAAAIGRVQLKRLPEFTKRRNEIVAFYNLNFNQEWTGNHLYPYFVKYIYQVKRLIDHLKSKGIQTSYHYPNTDWKGVSLPFYPLLKDSEIEYIVQSVKNYENQV